MDVEMTNIFSGFFENYKIFFEEEEALLFVLRLTEKTLPLLCSYCSETSICVKKNYQRKSGIFLKCRNCKRKCIFSKYFDRSYPNIPLGKILLSAFLYVSNLRNYQVLAQVNISEHSYIDLKNGFRRVLLSITDCPKIGGPASVFQIDETACNRRRLITNPTSMDPYVRGTVWLIGLVPETTGEIRLKVLANRHAETIYDFINENLIEGSIIKTDGYPSYPPAVQRHNSEHIVVNHTMGFVNEEGDHTNTIESVWSRIKSDIRARCGVRYDKLQEYAEEYQTLFNNRRRNNTANINSLFVRLIKALFG